MRSILHRALAACASAFLAAQGAPLPVPADFPPLPIHGRTGDLAYGLWAMGQGYKASFHDGFVFVPLLGQAYAENLPLRWSTESVTVGGRDLESAPTGTTYAQPSPWRFEYRTGSVSECYDVRADGVEQSFVVHAAPAGGGDLVVRGRVLTALASPNRAAAHAGLTFHGPAGEPLVSYGAAVAFDGGGRRIPVTTSFQDGVVALTVPAAWLADATYPVTIDPLLSMVVRSMPGAVQHVDVAEDSISTNSLLATVEYAASASDHDIVAYLADSDFSPSTAVFSDLDAYRADAASAAYVGGAQRWVIVLRKLGATYAYPFVRNDLTLNGSGAPTHVTTGRTVIGGTRDGQAAMIVATTEYAPAPQVMAIAWNPTTRLTENWGLVHAPATNSNIERVHPAVNQVAKGDAWLVVWEEIDRASLATSIRANLVRRDGSRGTVLDLTYRPSGAPAHRMRPAVAGMDGRYLVACLAGPTADRDYASQVQTRRISWTDAASSGAPGTGRVLFTYGTSTAGELDLAYDDETRSHWGLIYRRATLLGTSVVLARLGYSGGNVEEVVLSTQPTSLDQWSPAVTFDRGGNTFTAGFASDTAGNPVWVGRLGYAPGASTTNYGVGCGGPTISSTPAPYAGHEFFRFLLGGASGSTVSALMLGGAQASFALDPIGMPGCRLYVGTDGMVTLPTAVVGSGSLLELPLPDAPAFLGDLYCQWLVVAPGQNTLGMKTSGGLLVHVR